MRFVLIFGMLVCIFLSGCEYFIPDTSRALSQNKQLEEMQHQTQQLERQTEAIERLADSVERLTTR